jgi:hypothetical protein
MATDAAAAGSGESCAKTRGGSCLAMLLDLSEQQCMTDEQIRAAFDRYDIDGAGLLDRKAVLGALSLLSLRRDTDAADLFARLDVDNDGVVNVSETCPCLPPCAVDACMHAPTAPSSQNSVHRRSRTWWRGVNGSGHSCEKRAAGTVAACECSCVCTALTPCVAATCVLLFLLILLLLRTLCCVRTLQAAAAAATVNAHPVLSLRAAS